MDSLPSVVAGHKEGKLLLDIDVVGVSVGLHAAEEVVLDSELVRFTVISQRELLLLGQAAFFDFVGCKPHDGVGSKFLDNGHGRNTEDAIDDVDDPVKGANIRLDYGGIDASAFHRDGNVVIWAVGGEVEPSVSVSRLDLKQKRRKEMIKEKPENPRGELGGNYVREERILDDFVRGEPPADDV